ncbi:MAG: hypothetical protein WA885_04670 [Phormidesmis sp.]
MFYRTCLALAIGIVIISLIGSFNNASSMSIRQQNSVDPRAQRYSRATYIVPVPYGSSYGGGGSSRSSYDGYRGGGPGTGK